MVCPKCNGLGLKPKCTLCGAIDYSIEVAPVKSEEKVELIKIPIYYQDRKFSIDKVLETETLQKSSKLVLEYVDNMVKSSENTLPKNSFVILLPDNCGKRVALYTIAKNILNLGYSVAPVLDTLTLSLLTQDKRNKHLLFSILSADLTIVYGTGFVSRKLSYKIFLDLCKSRSLRDLPTLYFDNLSFREISQWKDKNMADFKVDNKSELNRKEVPYIFDGVSREVTK